MNLAPKSSHTTTPARAQQLVILALGLCLTGLWAWRAGFPWPPSPALLAPQQKYFIEVSGDLPCPGLRDFPAPPTIQAAWEAAGGLGTVPGASQKLSNGTRIIFASNRAISQEPLSGPDLLTLGLALDPNRASATDLEAIPGLGPVLARRIVAFREEHEKFNDIKDMLKVKGLGPKILEKIRPYVFIIAHTVKFQEDLKEIPPWKQKIPPTAPPKP